MSASKQTAFDYIDEKSGVITDVSDKIWDYAELSLREYKSGELYAKVLKEEGFTVEHPFDNIETAFRASYGSGKPVIGILAEYDALTGLSQIAGSETRKELVADGNGHGCGHNLLGAGSMAAAFAIKKYLEEKGYDPLIYRFFCLQSHYRKALVFTWENLDNAKIAYDKLIARIAALNPENGTVDEASMTALKEKFQKALDADLNTSLAITTLYDVLKADMNDATKLALLDNFDQVLGLTLLSHAEAKRKEAAKTTSASTASGYQITGEGDPEIDALVLKRYEAKKAKNFAEADKIRDDLKAQGIEVADVRGGAVWKRI